MSYGISNISGEQNKSPYPFDKVCKIPLFLDLSGSTPTFVGAVSTFTATNVTDYLYLISIPLSVSEVLSIETQLSVDKGDLAFNVCHCTSPVFSNGTFTFYVVIDCINALTSPSPDFNGIYFLITTTNSSNTQFS